MGKLRDAEFCDIRFHHYRDMRLEWRPERVGERKKVSKSVRCKFCGGMVIPPCVACHPEFYANMRIFAIKLETNQSKSFGSLAAFAKARKKHGWTAGHDIDKKVDSLD